MIGRTISHYRIEQKLGEGGMGVVYRARDLTLNRPVAIKFLSADIGTEEQRRRFQQEAQTASSLNHPHILSVYEAGTDDGRQYLVSEYIDGVTLREWVRGQHVSVRQIVELMVGVGDALACAHAVGIVHRDIKPENILVAQQGYAKLVDFGVAKLLDVAAVPEADTHSARGLVTRDGALVGTVPYMAPEQVSGQPVDARTDIFAFGTVLYELLSGQQPFGGKTDTDVLHAILHTSPRPVAELHSEVPYLLQLVVEKALEKEPAERYQSMRELVVDLKRAQRHGAAAPPAGATAAVRRWRVGWLAPAAAGVLVAAGATAWFLEESDYFWRNPLVDAQFTRLTDFEGVERDASISQDGKFVVFLSDRDGPFDAWVGQVGTGEFHNLTKGRAPDLRLDELRNVRFSPDGSQVCFRVRVTGSAATNTWAVPTMGGLVRPFLEGGAELDWSPDRARIVYHSTDPGDPVFVTELDQKVGKQIFKAQLGVQHCHFPVWSPDGEYIYFVHGFPPDEMDIWRIRPTGADPERITFHNSRVAYPTLLDARTLLYLATAQDGSGQWLYGMDIERRVPHRISFGVEDYSSIAASADGRRLVVTVGSPKASLWRVPISDGIVDESGANRVALPTARAFSPRLGPGYLLYLSSKSGADGIWKLADGTATELWSGLDGRVTAGPAIAPGGSRIAFPVQKSGRTRLYLMNADGTGVRPLAEALEVRGAPAWSPDGQSIAVAAEQGKGARLFKIPVDGGSPVPVVEGYSIHPVWSPEGRFLVYSGADVGPIFPVRAVTVDGRPHALPDLMLSRGARRVCFLPGGTAIVVLKGEIRYKNFWLIDLKSGNQRQLTNFGREFILGDFDVSADGREIVFDRLKENADVVLIERRSR